MNNLAKKTSQVSTSTPLLIGVDMAKGQDSSVIHAFKNSEHENAHAIHSMVNSIMTLAMLNRDVLHINVAYSPATEDLEVKVFAADTDYFQACKTKFSRCVYLDAISTLEQLKALEDNLIDLVADAKDKAIGAC